MGYFPNTPSQPETKGPETLASPRPLGRSIKRLAVFVRMTVRVAGAAARAGLSPRGTVGFIAGWVAGFGSLARTGRATALRAGARLILLVGLSLLIWAVLLILLALIRLRLAPWVLILPALVGILAAGLAL